MASKPCKLMSRTMHWLALEPGIVKINTDASFLLESGQSAVGVVARDHMGLSSSLSTGVCTNA